MNKELEKAAFDYINSEAVKAENMQLAFGDFINGAEWMQKKMIEKACEWLYVYYPTLERAKSFEDAWEHFKKAMEK